MSSRFVVGIDLGTTNCAVSYVDTTTPNLEVQLFSIPQKNEEGVEESFSMLPSFYYLADDPAEDCVGVWARKQGSAVPTRLIHSAKSWLSNPAAERKERILPPEAFDEQRKLAVVDVLSRYLVQIKEAWNKRKAKKNIDDELEEQQIILTVPASFDEVARSLVYEAALQAGLRQITLLEEPQAAFYNWLMQHENVELTSGETVLVCDIGGGTTDFSLIQISESRHFERIAVGHHLLLGGDNMDIALSHVIQQKIGEELDSEQWLHLLHEARTAKEYLLNADKKSLYKVWIPGKGSNVVAGGIGLELTYSDIEEVLLNGFFGIHKFEEAAQLRKKSGIRTMGLAFESEPSITKHLAAFLQSHRKPRYILFNGGATKPHDFQQRIMGAIDHWYDREAPNVELLQSNSLDLAVSRGAAYFGKAKRGLGIRIKGGSARTYYLAVDLKNKERKALTILPRGAEEGVSYRTDHEFILRSNTPVSFELYHSHVRLGDQPGELIDIDEEQMWLLPPIHTLLKYGKQTEVPVHLTIHLTEIGTLELALNAGEQRWKLEFQVREAAHDVVQDETLDCTILDQAKSALQETFSIGSSENLKALTTKLEDHLERPKEKWPPSVLRSLFDPLLEQSHKRDLATHYESRFWNLAGYFLRPGRGYPLDDHRVKEVWKLILEDFQKNKPAEVMIQKWICYRRIAAGLSRGQQAQLFNALYPTLFSHKRDTYAYGEKLRALAALELVEVSHKVKLGNAIIKRIEGEKAIPADYWALGRLGARHLLYGSVANVVTKKVCENWLTRLLEIPEHDKKQFPFLVTMLARKTDSHHLNISETLHKRVKATIDSEFYELLAQERELTWKEQERFFGDSLPAGLILQEPSQPHQS